MHPPGDVTRLLSAWTEGDRQSLDELMTVVYDELHRIALHHWRTQPSGHTLQPTALIHEAYLKLAGAGAKTPHDRAHFLALASMAMRQILVNHAQARLSEKRGGGQDNVSLDGIEAALEHEAKVTVALHDALKHLEAIDPRRSRVIELRYFGGLDVEETAQVLGISTITVKRDWRAARAWLAMEMGNGNVGEANED